MTGSRRPITTLMCPEWLKSEENPKADPAFVHDIDQTTTITALGYSFPAIFRIRNSNVYFDSLHSRHCLESLSDVFLSNIKILKEDPIFHGRGNSISNCDMAGLFEKFGDNLPRIKSLIRIEMIARHQLDIRTKFATIRGEEVQKILEWMKKRNSISQIRSMHISLCGR